MKGRILYCALFMLAIGLKSCVDPFEPPRGNYEELVVIEAFINDSGLPQQIKVSLSYPLDTGDPQPVSGANVVISDLDGNNYQFAEVTAGVYQSDTSRFKPEIGAGYLLAVSRGDGSTYRSRDTVYMKQTPPIESLYFRQTTGIVASGEVKEGIEIVVDTRGETNDDTYFRYEWEETAKLVPPLPSFFDYSPSEGIFLREDDISNCWIEEPSSSINLATTEGLTTSEISAHPITFLSFENPALNVRYSIKVKQYLIDNEAYLFWKSLKESNETTGSLFDVQPFPLTGNMGNLNDPAEPVLGYFDMATESSERIYVDRFDLPLGLVVPSYFRECASDLGDTLVAPNLVPAFYASGLLISSFQFPMGYIMAKPSCIDCTLVGSNVKPEFWED